MCVHCPTVSVNVMSGLPLPVSVCCMLKLTAPLPVTPYVQKLTPV